MEKNFFFFVSIKLFFNVVQNFIHFNTIFISILIKLVCYFYIYKKFHETFKERLFLSFLSISLSLGRSEYPLQFSWLPNDGAVCQSREFPSLSITSQTNKPNSKSYQIMVNRVKFVNFTTNANYLQILMAATKLSGWIHKISVGRIKVSSIRQTLSFQVSNRASNMASECLPKFKKVAPSIRVWFPTISFSKTLFAQDFILLMTFLSWL